jgi:hypothetical protein
VKSLLKFVIVVGLMFGGWALAAASLHVVKSPGSMVYGKVPFCVQLVTKNNLTFRDTYVDTSKWSVADLDAHPDVVARLQQLNKTEPLAHLDPTATPDAHASATPAPAAPAPSEKPSKSIFDFNHR